MMLVPLILSILFLHVAAKNKLFETHKKDIVKDSYFIEFKGNYHNSSACKENISNFRKYSAYHNVSFSIRFEFCVLFRGISINLSNNSIDIPRIIGFDEIKSVYPIIKNKLPQVQKGNTETSAYQANNYAKGNVALFKQSFSLDGSGVKVGIIDTGIDSAHPAFGSECSTNVNSSPPTNCRVKHGYNFADNNHSPSDGCSGHGTHVAGIIGAKSNTMNGIATNVTLGVYKIFPCSSSDQVGSDVVVKALEKAYMDGMDVINMSFGGGSPWSEYPDSLVANRLSKLGVIVVGACGNDGNKGLFEISSPSLADGVLSVASYDSDTYTAKAFSLNSLNDSRFDYTIDQNGMDFQFTKTAIITKDGCLKNNPKELHGKILVVPRGDCGVDEMALFARNAGAKGMIIINNSTEQFTPKLKKNLKLPVVGVSKLVGKVLSKHAKNPKARLTTPKYFVNKNKNSISSFSSWGPGPELELKPDLTAPGGLIYSTYPLSMGGYKTLSGTSMAAPYISGVFALLLQYSRKYNIKKESKHFKALLMITSVPKKEDAHDVLYSSVTRQGFGVIDAYAAAITETMVHPIKLRFKTSTNKSHMIKRLKISNLSTSNTYKYNLRHFASNTVTNYENAKRTSTMNHANKTASVETSIKSILLKPGEETVVKVLLKPPSLLESEHWIYSGYIKISVNQSNANELNIPYLGMVGKYESLAIMELKDYPIIQTNRDSKEIRASEFEPKAPIKINSKSKNDTLTLRLKIDHPTKTLMVKLLNTKTNKEVCFLKDGVRNYLSRNDETVGLNSELAFLFDLECFHKSSFNKLLPYFVLKGIYKIVVYALMPMGNIQKLNDYQKWESPEIEVF